MAEVTAKVIELELWVTCLDCGAQRRCMPSCFVCRACLGMNGVVRPKREQKGPTK